MTAIPTDVQAEADRLLAMTPAQLRARLARARWVRIAVMCTARDQARASGRTETANIIQDELDRRLK